MPWFRGTACEACGLVFDRWISVSQFEKIGRPRFCSTPCAARTNAQYLRRKNKPCDRCRRVFYPGYSRQRFCSIECKRLHQKATWSEVFGNHRKVLKRATSIVKRTYPNLPSGYVVHHIDCDPTNNRPGNLLVCTRRYHAYLHSEMARRWAERYKPK